MSVLLNPALIGPILSAFILYFSLRFYLNALRNEHYSFSMLFLKRNFTIKILSLFIIATLLFMAARAVSILYLLNFITDDFTLYLIRIPLDGASGLILLYVFFSFFKITRRKEERPEKEYPPMPI
ncbi:hypothetical protein CW702_00135 [Candidatus Bathyarchaeota archaeon]|nr:MAG: hypothetical protein CW702_00135 [Candidatus Bathyarchaeota archaeon]